MDRPDWRILTRTVLYTALALVAFAANSVLCRIALLHGTIDAATFSAIRLTAGAAVLLAFTMGRQKPVLPMEGSWTSATMLFLYAVPFSFAYASLSTGIGALILFGCVQVTMMSAALWSGERPGPLQWLGLGLALAGLVYLVLPGLSAPPPAGAALMALAGIAWGAYTLRGRSAKDAVANTAGNFVRSVPLVLVVSLMARHQSYAEVEGVLLAVASGALASGLGYVVWYSALRRLTTTCAAAVQLAVPVLAALGGVIFLAEDVSMRLAVATVMVLAGIFLALVGRFRSGSVPLQSMSKAG